MHLDDITLGGLKDDILLDIQVIQTSEEIGLCLNNSKSEIICHDPIVRGSILCVLPGCQVVDPCTSTRCTPGRCDFYRPFW